MGCPDCSSIDNAALAVRTSLKLTGELVRTESGYRVIGSEGVKARVCEVSGVDFATRLRTLEGKKG